MSTVKSKKLQVGTDATSSNNFTIYQPATPDGTLRIGVGNADSPTEVGRFDSNGYVATNAPAFSAYLSSSQSTSAATHTKIAFDTESFDLTSDYDTTNYRFTPSVEGYYQINVVVYVDITPRGIIRLYKNGALYKLMTDLDTNDTRVITGSVLIYMNGTTDYIEIYGWRTSAGNISGGTEDKNHFSAFLARAV